MDSSDWNVELAYLNDKRLQERVRNHNTLHDLYNEYENARAVLAEIEERMEAEKSRLRNLVTVREARSYWELTYNGRTIRVTPNARGEFKVTENKVKIDIPRGIRHTIPALRLAMAQNQL